MGWTNTQLAVISGQLTYEASSDQDNIKRSSPILGMVRYPIGEEQAVVTLESRPFGSGGYQLSARKVSDGAVIWVRFVAGALTPVVKPVWEPSYNGYNLAEGLLRYNELHQRLLFSFPVTVDGVWEDTIFTHDAQTGFKIGQDSIGVPTRYGWADSLGVNADIIIKTWRVYQVDDKIRAWRWNPTTGLITEMWEKSPSDYTNQPVILDCHGRKVLRNTDTDYVYNEETEEEEEVEIFTGYSIQAYRSAIYPPYDTENYTIRACFSSFNPETYKILHYSVVSLSVEDGSTAWKYEETLDIDANDVPIDASSLVIAASEASSVISLANSTQSPPYNQYEGGFEPYIGFNDTWPKTVYDYWPPRPGSGAWLPVDCEFINFHELDPENPFEQGNHKIHYLEWAGAQQQDTASAEYWEIRRMPQPSDFQDPDEELYAGEILFSELYTHFDPEEPPEGGTWVRISDRNDEIWITNGGDPSDPANWIQSRDGVIDRSYDTSITYGLPGSAVVDPVWNAEPLRFQPSESSSGNYPDTSVQEYDEESDDEDPPPVHHNGCMCIDSSGVTYVVINKVEPQIVWSGSLYRARRLNSARPLDIDACIESRYPFGDGTDLSRRTINAINDTNLVTGENYPCSIGNGTSATHPATPMEFIEQTPPNNQGEADRFYDTIEECLLDVGWEPETWTYTYFDPDPVHGGEVEITRYKQCHAIINAPEYSFHLGDPIDTYAAPTGGGSRPWWHFEYTYNGASSFWNPVAYSCFPPWVATTPNARYAWNPLPPYGPVLLSGPLADCYPGGARTQKPYGSYLPLAGVGEYNYKIVCPGSSSPPSLDYKLIAEPQLLIKNRVFLQAISGEGGLLWEKDLSEEYTHETYGTTLYRVGVVRMVIPTHSGGIFVLKDKPSSNSSYVLSSQGIVEYREKNGGEIIWSREVTFADTIQAYYSEELGGEPWILVVPAGVSPYTIDHSGNVSTASFIPEGTTVLGGQSIVNGSWIFVKRSGSSWSLRIVKENIEGL